MRLPRRKFIKRGALFVPTLFFPKLIRAQMATLPGGMIARRVGGGPSTLLSSITAYWKLDESSGNAADSVGTNTMVNNNTLTYAAAKINNGAVCENAADRFLSAADDAAFDFTNQFSFSLWVNRSTITTAQAIAAKWTYSTQGCWVLQTGESDGADLVVYIATSLTDPGTGCRMDFNDANQSVSTWYHIVLIYDGTQTGDANRLKLYQNNTALTLSAFAGAVPSSLQNDSALLCLGHFGGDLARSLDGTIDEVGFWSRPLTSGEVAELYNSGGGKTYPFT